MVETTTSSYKCTTQQVVVSGIIFLGIQCLFFFQKLHTFHTVHRTEATKAWLPPLPNGDSRGARPSQNSLNRTADGTFNGYPVYYHEVQQQTDPKSYYSQVHCVGETYPGKPMDLSRIAAKRKKEQQAVKDLDWTWLHRSCKFSFFCLDTATKEYQIYQDPDEKELINYFESRLHDIDVRQTIVSDHTVTLNHRPNSTYAVSVGGVNMKWTLNDHGVQRLKWFPKILTQPPKNFYTLEKDVVLVPFHSLASFNPGHLVWDDFLPVYSLMRIFGLEDLDLLMLRHVLPGNQSGLWASCDWIEERSKECRFMLEKFGHMMKMRDGTSIATQMEAVLDVDGEKRSNLVCARYGAAGLGALTDHGTAKGHGWEPEDYETTHNHGRAGFFYEFREYAMRNLKVPQKPWNQGPLKIIFSRESTAKRTRQVDFNPEIRLLQEHFDPSEVVVEAYKMSKYTLAEQAALVGDAAIFVTACGGGAVTATFLPRGASLLIYYKENGGIRNNRGTGKPARLDWDIFNNLGYLHTVWVPQLSKYHEEDTKHFLSLIVHEINAIRRQR